MTWHLDDYRCTLLGEILRRSFQETSPRNTAAKHRGGSVGSVVANHRGGGETSMVVTTLLMGFYVIFYFMLLLCLGYMQTTFCF